MRTCQRNSQAQKAKRDACSDRLPEASDVLRRFAPSGKREWRHLSRAATERRALCVCREGGRGTHSYNGVRCMDRCRVFAGKVVVNMSSIGGARRGMKSMLQDKVGWKGRRITMCRKEGARACIKTAV
jgi:hypothetical protein